MQLKEMNTKQPNEASVSIDLARQIGKIDERIYSGIAHISRAQMDILANMLCSGRLHRTYGQWSLLMDKIGSRAHKSDRAAASMAV